MIKTLQLSDLLRYTFSGIIFLAAFFASKDGISSLISMTGSKTISDATGTIAVAVVVGSLCYSVHRLIYRKVIIRLQIRRLRCLHPDLHLAKDFDEEEFDRDYARWVRSSKYPAFQERMALWAAHVHFLYCSAWAALVGALAGRLLLAYSAGSRGFLSHSLEFFSNPLHLPTFCFILLSTVGLATIAYLQDHVLTYYDCKLQTPGMIHRLREDLIKPEPQIKKQEAQ